jgi:hypothetical protein
MLNVCSSTHHTIALPPWQEIATRNGSIPTVNLKPQHQTEGTVASEKGIVQVNGLRVTLLCDEWKLRLT